MVSFDHDGPLVRLTNGRKGLNTVDLLVTPNHRQWYRPGGARRPDDDFSTGWVVSEVQDMPTSLKRYQTAARAWQGSFQLPSFLAPGADPLTFAEFVGLWVAEGWIHSYGTAVQIGQSHVANPGTCARIRDLLTALGLPFSEGSHAAAGRRAAKTWWYIRSRELVAWLRTNAGEKSEGKKLSRAVLDWPQEMLKALIAGYLAGDGSKLSPKLGIKPGGTGRTCNKNRNPITDMYHGFGTCSKALFDGLQEVFCKLGVTVRPNKPYMRKAGLRPMYYGSLVGRPYVIASSSASQKIETPYRGRVYCCSVPHGLLFVRRNGVIAVSGNSFLQQKLLGTPADLSGRGQILPDPDLHMDEIGVPESVAWEIYHPFVVRRLVQAGMPRAEAARVVEARGDAARRALVDEMGARPVTATRYPALHRYSVMAFRPRLAAGDAIRLTPIVTKGYGADFDGDTMTLHVPLTDDAVKEAYEKMLPSKNLYSVSDFKPKNYLPNMEFVQGLHHASVADAGNAPVEFRTRKEALAALKAGKVGFDTRVRILED